MFSYFEPNFINEARATDDEFTCGSYLLKMKFTNEGYLLKMNLNRGFLYWRWIHRQTDISAVDEFTNNCYISTEDECLSIISIYWKTTEDEFTNDYYQLKMNSQMRAIY